jgi:hypothetical protein
MQPGKNNHDQFEKSYKGFRGRIGVIGHVRIGSDIPSHANPVGLHDVTRLDDRWHP